MNSAPNSHVNDEDLTHAFRSTYVHVNLHRTRPRGSESQFDVELPRTLHAVKQVQVQHLFFPRTFYDLDARLANNTVQFIAWVDAGSTEGAIRRNTGTITARVYTFQTKLKRFRPGGDLAADLATLATEMQTAYNANPVPGGPATMSTLTIALDSSTDQLVFTSNVRFQFEFPRDKPLLTRVAGLQTVTSEVVPSGMKDVLGMDENREGKVHSTFTGGNWVLKSASSPRLLSPISHLFLHCSLISDEKSMHNKQRQTPLRQCIGVIPLTGSSFGNEIAIPQEWFYPLDVHVNTFTRMRLELRTPAGHLLDLRSDQIFLTLYVLHNRRDVGR